MKILLSIIGIIGSVCAFLLLEVYYVFNFLTLQENINPQQLSDFYFYRTLTIALFILVIFIFIFSIIHLLKGVKEKRQNKKVKP
jgi:uncharacterized BrkB/YihY/UPF0761 family membrane protein